MKAQWTADFTARAAAQWTPKERRRLLGDKHVILDPVEAAPLLRVLGLLKRDASMPPNVVRKYMQINHMVALLEPILLDLVGRRPVVRVVDVGCGSSYLTLLLAWCFAHRWKHPAQILGVDRNAQVVEKSRERAAIVDLDSLLRFEASAAADLDLTALWGDAFGEMSVEPPLVHALFALHACDTATDDALALGVGIEAEFIAAAPCCQSQLSRAWAALDESGAEGAFAPVWRSPHLRRELAATMTDTMRTLLLRACGYRVTAMEFVPSEHTPKNTMLRAVRVDEDREGPLREYVDLCAASGGASITMEGLLPEPHQRRVREAREAGSI